jgi:hypothetical protein
MEEAKMKYRVWFMQGMIENFRGWYPQFDITEVEPPRNSGAFDYVLIESPNDIAGHLRGLTIVNDVEVLN